MRRGRFTGLVALFIASLLPLAPSPGSAATLRWSSQGDYLSADPHAQNEGLNNNVNDFVFERLTTRDRSMKIVPSLATAWEQKAPGTWRFALRRGVRFHDGTPFTAADVVFSFERAKLPSSNFKVFAVPVGTVRRVDDFTVEIDTRLPRDVLLENVNTIRIVSRAWCEKHGALRPQDFKTGEETYASRHANGTGPFVLVKREAEVATTLRRHAGWWGTPEKRFEGNVEEIVYRPIRSDATRMAALVTGELDVVIDPPLQDIPRLRRDPKIRVVEGIENRVIFLVMDQGRATPFRDIRVRQAVYHAIDVEAIRRQVMRGLAKPTGSMVPTEGRSFPEIEPRLLPHDPARAKALLAEAGFPGGFDFTFLCPNNRYVNDERICTALAGMFAKAGMRARLEAIPRAQFFQRVDNFDFGMHLYGWGGAATDPGFTLTPVIRSRGEQGKGDFNSGRYSDAALDALIDAIEVEQDAARRSAMMLQAFQRVRDQVLLVPLHRQVIPWATRANVVVQHRPDNVVEALWTRVD